MYIFITILIVIIAILLGIVVLIQNPKGGGVNSTFGGASQQIFGAARSTDVVEKTTWTLAIMMLAFCLFSALFLGKTTTATAATQNGKAPSATTSTQNETEPEKRAREMGASSPANAIPRQQAPAQQAPAQQAPAQPAPAPAQKQ